MTEPLWSPSPAAFKESAMAKFLCHMNDVYGLALSDYSALYDWSIRCSEDFWQAFATFCPLHLHSAPTTILERKKRFQDSRWFVGSTLNFAEHLLKRADDATALIATSERGDLQTLRYDELSRLVRNLAHQMKQLGLNPGDRVAAVLPNTPAAIIAMLATTSLGAIWSACSPDFGINSLVDRFSQIEPKLLITVDGHFYKGKTFSHTEKNQQLQSALPSVQTTLLVSHLNALADLTALKNTKRFEDCSTFDAPPLTFEAFPFDHPLYILYSSGTTGKPKCLVHGAGRVLLQHLKELMLHTDVNAKTRIFFNCTTTWMMWHWLVSSLALGATVVLYEGAVNYPTRDHLFQQIEAAKINVFGVGAKVFELCAKSKLTPHKTHNLSSLTTILSTGSPLLPASFDYIYEHVKNDIRVSSISGGTDIISCFALGNPLLPVYSGELQCRGLGMDVQIFNATGKSVVDEKGDLVCASPFPSMPLYFWNDPTGALYQKAYFEKFNGVWTHGDYALLTPQGSLIIFGRSDATLNPSGVRIGSAEIYQQLEKIDAILESLVVSQKWRSDERIILFVVLRPNLMLTPERIHEIKSIIRTNTSAHHVPAKIIQVTDIPRTANNKIAEIAVRKIINGETIDNEQALANPECLAEFRQMVDLQDD